MTVQRFKLACNNANIPMLSRDSPRAVMVPQLDSAPRTPRQFVGMDASVDYNMAQVVYAENAMPTSSGITSVGYRELIAPTVNSDFDSIFALRDADENTVLYSPAGGKNYVYDTATTSWISTTLEEVYDTFFVSFNKDPSTCNVSYCYVDGFTFVCFSELEVVLTSAPGGVDASIYWWNPAVKRLEPAISAKYQNLPFDKGTISGISSANGYLIVYSGLEVAWGRFTGTAFDFAPIISGEISGSGTSIPEAVQGPIRAVLAVAGGFIMFTQRNAIGASYTANNLLTPWVFREIPDAGGLESYEQATVEGSLGAVYAYTSAGLQRLSLNSAELVFPAVSDFLSERRIERFRVDLNELYDAGTSLDFYTKVTAVGNRYLVISYGTFPGIYSFALVHDMGLQRWGKLRMVHRDCFYYNYGSETASLTYSMLGDVPYDSPALGTYAETRGQSNALVAAPHSLAFLREDGSVVIANWSQQVRDADTGVVIIGRVQLSRSRNTQLNRVEIEGLVEGTVAVQPSTNGRTLNAAEDLVLIERAGDYALLGGMIDCKNFNLVIQGTFNLSSVILEAQPSGSY